MGGCLRKGIGTVADERICWLNLFFFIPGDEDGLSRERAGSQQGGGGRGTKALTTDYRVVHLGKPLGRCRFAEGKRSWESE